MAPARSSLGIIATAVGMEDGDRAPLLEPGPAPVLALALALALAGGAGGAGGD